MRAVTRGHFRSRDKDGGHTIDRFSVVEPEDLSCQSWWWLKTSFDSADFVSCRTLSHASLACFLVIDAPQLYSVLFYYGASDLLRQCSCFLHSTGSLGRSCDLTVRVMKSGSVDVIVIFRHGRIRQSSFGRRYIDIKRDVVSRLDKSVLVWRTSLKHQLCPALVSYLEWRVATQCMR